MSQPDASVIEYVNNHRVAVLATQRQAKRRLRRLLDGRCASGWLTRGICLMERQSGSAEVPKPFKAESAKFVGTH